MSKRHEEREMVQPDATVSLTLTLSPSLSTDELTHFNRRAMANGETVAARVARLIREDLESEKEDAA